MYVALKMRDRNRERQEETERDREKQRETENDRKRLRETEKQKETKGRRARGREGDRKGREWWREIAANSEIKSSFFTVEVTSCKCNWYYRT